MRTPRFPRFKLPDHVGGLQVATWIRQLSLLLFAMSALVGTITNWHFGHQQDEHEAQRQRRDACVRDVSGDLARIQGERSIIQTDISTIGWLALLARVDGATGDEIRDSTDHIRRLAAELHSTDEGLAKAQSRRDRINKICA